jgi:enoyl-CoA hydratase
MAVSYEKDGRIARITLNRPEAMNALDDAMNDALANAWDAFAGDDGLDLAIVTGMGAAFCAGADLKSWIPKWDGADAGAPRRNAAMGLAGGITRGRHRLTKPIIAAINGHALGGGFELALACDIRIAADSASFGVFEVRHGLHQGDGGLVRLVAVAGVGVALDLTLTGRRVGADEALRLGLVSQVVPSDDLEAAATRTAEMILRNSQGAVRSAKETVMDIIGRPLDDALRLEAINGYSCVGDFSELRSRLAVFQGPGRP